MNNHSQQSGMMSPGDEFWEMYLVCEGMTIVCDGEPPGGS